jgi:RimJ/RimL family protein N-acetyltransferase
LQFSEQDIKLGVVLKDVRKVIGIITLSHIDRQKQSAEIGIWIGKNYWAKGVMLEAEFLMIRWAFNFLNMHKIYAVAHGENIASIITMKKLGFEISQITASGEDAFGRKIDIINMELSRDKFKDNLIKAGE